MFTHAIVRRPAPSLVDGITSAPELGKPDYRRALEQHDAYVAALEACGLQVQVLDPLPEFPDSCFVEDTAVVTRCGAVVDNPGAPSRNGEAALMEPVLRAYFGPERVARIEAPGTLEGGDVMMVGDRFYVGRSARTNAEGVRQFAAVLDGWGLACTEVPLEHVPHLKTGVNYLGEDPAGERVLLVSGEFVDNPLFDGFRRIVVPPEEAYAANSLWVNGTVIVPAGYPTVLARIQEAGFPTVEVDTSEYRKVDGGLSCLSLRFAV